MSCEGPGACLQKRRRPGSMVRIFAAVKPLSRSIARHPLETWEANILHELLAFGQRVGKTRPLFAQRADRNKVSNHSPERGEPGGDAAVKLKALDPESADNKLNSSSLKMSFKEVIFPKKVIL